ncbi:MAG: replicative DNA helicase, partial [Nitrospira defluvii]|nr:replicative DNA helicase [Nitrospira defluvii]
MTAPTIEQPSVPPHDQEAEQAILGAILLCPGVLTIVGEHVTEHDLYDFRYRKIFAAMCRLADAGKAIDNVTVSEDLKRAGSLQEIGGSATVAELIQAVPSASNVMTHCRIVREKARRRELRRIGYELCVQAYDEQESLPAIVERAEQEILSLDHIGTAELLPSIGQLVNDRLTHLEMLYKRKTTITGISTGFSSLDALTAGLHPGTLNIIASRTSMGKTSLALSIAAHVALCEHQPVQMFSLEMSKEELIDRLFSQTALVDLHAIRTGQVQNADWMHIANAAEQLSNAPLHIDDSGTLTMTQLRRRARRAKAKTGMGLMIVDYLQLMTPSLRGESRQQEIGDMSRSLKLLAKELAVPIVALSQLNRKVEDRNDKRPMLSDLRDSGAIEQDA